MEQTIINKHLVLAAFSSFVLVIQGCSSSSADSSESDSVAVDTIVALVEPSEPSPSWVIKTEDDEMRGITNTWATATSENTFDQGFPYEETRLYLTVRNMPEKYGTDVLMQIHGQFGGSEYRGTNFVTMKFDDEQPSKWYFNDAAEGSDCIFIKNKTQLINKLKSCKKLIVEVPIFDHGTKQFKFSFNEPLKWE